MKQRALLLVVLATLAFCSLSYADVTNVVYADDGDGALTCVYTFQEISDEYILKTTGEQHWSPGHMLGYFYTDSADDPTVTVRNTLDNDTGFTWTAFRVNVYMTNTFSLSNPNVFTPGGWTSAITQVPTWNGTRGPRNDRLYRRHRGDERRHVGFRLQAEFHGHYEGRLPPRVYSHTRAVHGRSDGFGPRRTGIVAT